MKFRIPNPNKELVARIEEDVHKAIFPIIEEYMGMASDFSSKTLHLLILDRALNHQMFSYYLDSNLYVEDPAFDPDDENWCL